MQSPPRPESKKPTAACLAGSEARLAHPALELLVGKDPAVLRRKRHVDREECRELRRSVRRVGHHVEDEKPPPGLEGPVRAPQDVDYLLRRLLVESAEYRHGVVGLRLVFVRVVVAGAALDAVREAELLDIARRLRSNRLQVYRHACRGRIRLAHQYRVRAWAAGEVEDLPRKRAQHRDNALADAHRAAEHRRGKRLCARCVFAEVDFGLLHGPAGLGKFRELPPRGIHVAVVANRLREVRGTAWYQGHLAGGRVEVLPIAFFEKPLGDAGVREKPHAAAPRVKRSRLDLLEHAAVDGGEKHGAAVVGAREIDYFLYGFHVSGSLPFHLDLRVLRDLRACRARPARRNPSRSRSPRRCS